MARGRWLLSRRRCGTFMAFGRWLLSTRRRLRARLRVRTAHFGRGGSFVDTRRYGTLLRRARALDGAVVIITLAIITLATGWFDAFDGPAFTRLRPRRRIG